MVAGRGTNHAPANCIRAQLAHVVEPASHLERTSGQHVFALDQNSKPSRSERLSDRSSGVGQRCVPDNGACPVDIGEGREWSVPDADRAR